MRRRGFLKAALGGVLAVALPIPALPRLVNAGTGASVVIHNHPYVRRDTAYICPVEPTIILRTTISYEEVERARRGGAEYFCAKLREMTEEVRRR